MSERIITITLTEGEAVLLLGALEEVDWDHHDYLINKDFARDSKEVVSRIADQLYKETA